MHAAGAGVPISYQDGSGVKWPLDMFGNLAPLLKADGTKFNLAYWGPDGTLMGGVAPTPSSPPPPPPPSPGPPPPPPTPSDTGVPDRFGLPISVITGMWVSGIPGFTRLRLTGTGTVVMDSRDSLGNISPSVFTKVVSNATNQIEFPFYGDSAVDIRATFPNTMGVFVI